MSKSVEQHIDEAINHYRLGQYKEALGCCEKVIEIDPNCARAYHGRGLALVKLGKRKKALEEYQKAIKLTPRNAKLYADMAQLLFILYNYEKSGQYYRKAIQLNAKYQIDYRSKTEELVDKAFALRSQWMEGEWKHAEAIAAFQEALLFNPLHVQAKDYLSRLQSSPPNPPYFDPSHPTKGELEYEKKYYNQWGSIPPIHPFNCRCPECWEP